jgi:hypothetical protein
MFMMTEVGPMFIMTEALTMLGLRRNRARLTDGSAPLS